MRHLKPPSRYKWDIRFSGMVVADILGQPRRSNVGNYKSTLRNIPEEWGFHTYTTNAQSHDILYNEFKNANDAE